MNYTFTSVSYGQEFLSPMPTIVAEVEIIPSTPKEWRDIHQVINSRSLKELEQLEAIFNSRPTLPNIKNVYFNPPATVVLWDDGTKTIVKCQDGDTYSRETGLALCVAKKAMGNKSNFNDIFKKWIPEEKGSVKLNIDECPKGCGTCKFERVMLSKMPCCTCDLSYSNWKPSK